MVTWSSFNKNVMASSLSKYGVESSLSKVYDQKNKSWIIPSVQDEATTGVRHRIPPDGDEFVSNFGADAALLPQLHHLNQDVELGGTIKNEFRSSQSLVKELLFYRSHCKGRSALPAPLGELFGQRSGPANGWRSVGEGQRPNVLHIGIVMDQEGQLLVHTWLLCKAPEADRSSVKINKWSAFAKQEMTPISLSTFDVEH